ncbi:uncharacterized protein BJ171DRAFT_504749 [Polychytrium aggregatum]|uniref:uncharacterized protein n=1 Tax=Polychytrium aggregatum TaxID=110093 RepID=UPI0022FEF089|nr:uncharacterized protein BJ171DRAFT_504749 [Polychytrium aggregatum]KAI9204585.1 hypothetical protein BJ171DRAFT_504749 [Polychytrium aggregatum]
MDRESRHLQLRVHGSDPNKMHLALQPAQPQPTIPGDARGSVQTHPAMSAHSWLIPQNPFTDRPSLANHLALPTFLWRPEVQFASLLHHSSFPCPGCSLSHPYIPIGASASPDDSDKPRKHTPQLIQAGPWERDGRIVYTRQGPVRFIAWWRQCLECRIMIPNVSEPYLSHLPPIIQAQLPFVLTKHGGYELELLHQVFSRVSQGDLPAIEREARTLHDDVVRLREKQVAQYRQHVDLFNRLYDNQGVHDISGDASSIESMLDIPSLSRLVQELQMLHTCRGASQSNPGLRFTWRVPAPENGLVWPRPVDSSDYRLETHHATNKPYRNSVADAVKESKPSIAVADPIQPTNLSFTALPASPVPVQPMDSAAAENNRPTSSRLAAPPDASLSNLSTAPSPSRRRSGRGKQHRPTEGTREQSAQREHPILSAPQHAPAENLPYPEPSILAQSPRLSVFSSAPSSPLIPFDVAASPTPLRATPQALVSADIVSSGVSTISSSSSFDDADASKANAHTAPVTTAAEASLTPRDSRPGAKAPLNRAIGHAVQGRKPIQILPKPTSSPSSSPLSSPHIQPVPVAVLGSMPTGRPIAPGTTLSSAEPQKARSSQSAKKSSRKPGDKQAQIMPKPAFLLPLAPGSPHSPQNLKSTRSIGHPSAALPMRTSLFDNLGGPPSRGETAFQVGYRQSITIPNSPGQSSIDYFAPAMHSLPGARPSCAPAASGSHAVQSTSQPLPLAPRIESRPFDTQETRNATNTPLFSQQNHRTHGADGQGSLVSHSSRTTERPDRFEPSSNTREALMAVREPDLSIDHSGSSINLSLPKQEPSLAAQTSTLHAIPQNPDLASVGRHWSGYRSEGTWPDSKSTGSGLETPPDTPCPAHDEATNKPPQSDLGCSSATTTPNPVHETAQPSHKSSTMATVPPCQPPNSTSRSLEREVAESLIHLASVNVRTKHNSDMPSGTLQPAQANVTAAPPHQRLRADEPGASSLEWRRPYTDPCSSSPAPYGAHSQFPEKPFDPSLRSNDQRSKALPKTTATEQQPTTISRSKEWYSEYTVHAGYSGLPFHPPIDSSNPNGNRASAEMFYRYPVGRESVIQKVQPVSSDQRSSTELATQSRKAVSLRSVDDKVPFAHNSAIVAQQASPGRARDANSIDLQVATPRYSALGLRPAPNHGLKHEDRAVAPDSPRENSKMESIPPNTVAGSGSTRWLDESRPPGNEAALLDRLSESPFPKPGPAAGRQSLGELSPGSKRRLSPVASTPPKKCRLISSSD